MYAVIETGGKQHRVTPGEKLRIDLISNVQKGDALTFDKVLMVSADQYAVGKPYVANAKVQAVVTDMGTDGEGVKAKKVYAFKKIRRHGFHKTRGHRQRYTEIEIKSINA